MSEPKMVTNHIFEECTLFDCLGEEVIIQILNYYVLNALDFYDYLWELKYKLQIERMICNGTNNDEQFGKFLFIYNAL